MSDSNRLVTFFSCIPSSYPAGTNVTHTQCAAIQQVVGNITFCRAEGKELGPSHCVLSAICPLNDLEIVLSERFPVE